MKKIIKILPLCLVLAANIGAMQPMRGITRTNSDVIMADAHGYAPMDTSSPMRGISFPSYTPYNAAEEHFRKLVEDAADNYARELAKLIHTFPTLKDEQKMRILPEYIRAQVRTYINRRR